MSIIEGIRRFTEQIGAGYSRTATTAFGGAACKYNYLYHLCLLHVVGDKRQVISDGLCMLSRDLCNGLLSEDDSLIGVNHGRDYITLHLSALYYQLASDYLELPPIAAFEGWDATMLQEALLRIDNSSAWYASNMVMSYGVLFAHNARQGRNFDCLPAIIAHLNRNQDITTGLWLGSKRASKINAMAATFHYLPLYSYLGACPSFADRMFDSIARLANDHDGSFSLPAGYACLDYDGISALKYLADRVLNDRECEQRVPALLSISTALRTHLLAMQNDDGGFPEAGPSRGAGADIAHWTTHVLRNRCFWSAVWNARFIQKSWTSPNRLIHANSVRACRAQISESNAFSTWFRYMTLACCEDIIERYGTLSSREAPPRRLPLPGLGYF